MTKRRAAPLDDPRLARAIVRIHAGVLALACAVGGGGTLFALTAWLLIKGGPTVGAHLQLLNQYFPGYSVSWRGSLIGMGYGALAGGAAGWLIGVVYNGVVWLRR